MFHSNTVKVPKYPETPRLRGGGIFPSLEGWPTGRGVRSLTHALSQRERGGRSMANIPLFRGVSDRTGCSQQHRESAKVPRDATPSVRGNIPLFRGVSDRTGCSQQHRESTKVLRDATPSMRANIPLFRGVADRTGCSAPSPIPSPRGRGVAKAWRIFPSLEGWPTGRGVRSPLGSVADYPVRHSPATPSRRGIWLPHPCPLSAGEGWPKHGEYSPL